MKTRHEVRDAIHGFIEFENAEKSVIDSRPFQRLRNIHQLAMTYQVYPGATHRRFEHSLGVMDVATRIFDQLFNNRITDSVRETISGEVEPENKKGYWRSVVRMAALLHDVGHLPFSHAAESELLPPGWNHERLTAEIIRSDHIAAILRAERPPIDPEDVIDVAYSLKDRLKVEPNYVLDPWKTLLNEIITGNTFGADRIDYLLRDSHHAGVAYGRFDPYRLIGGLRLVNSAEDKVEIGLDVGAIHAAEALLLARYFMYTQVYFHDVRRAYDIHLQDFLTNWLPGGRFTDSWEDLLDVSDNEVLAAIWQAARSEDVNLQRLAARVVGREHFRTVYTLIASHKKKRPTIFEDLKTWIEGEFGAANIKASTYGPKSEKNDFLVLNDDGSIESSLTASGVISSIPDIEVGLLFADHSICGNVEKAVRAKLIELLETNDGL